LCPTEEQPDQNLYIERAGLGEAVRVPLFQAIKVRPYGRGEAELNGVRFNRINA
jgi:hypothetical protein